ncbi:MAG: HAD family hydrolase [Lachnospiraceae bacterium]|nr:HAD family hydrolase [Lachnospiraceae bacterium]
MIKLIASDIDGTLLKDGGHELYEEYFEVIQKLLDHGVAFCAASGRHITGMTGLFGPVADQIYYICEGGALLRTSDHIMKAWSLPQGSYEELLEETSDIPGVQVMIDTADCVYVNAGEDSRLFRFIHDGYQFAVENVSDLTAIPEEEVLKLSLYSADVHVEESCADFLASDWMKKLSVAQAGTMWVDAISPKANKGEALKVLQEHLGVTKEETVYFGDNLNDLPAFGEAGMTVTVSNARDEVKEQADLIQHSYRHHGVLQQLQKILDEIEQKNSSQK